MENPHAYVIYDKFPQTRGHLLIIPKRHSETVFETNQEEQTAILDLLAKARAYLETTYKPDGYNIFVNCGKVAGQVVPHSHIHLVPRYTDDQGIKKSFGMASR